MTVEFINTPPPSLKLRRDEPTPFRLQRDEQGWNNKKTSKRLEKYKIIIIIINNNNNNIKIYL